MIGNSTAEYVWVRTWVFILNSIAPLSVACFVFIIFLRPPGLIPRLIGCWTAAEATFYFLIYLYQRLHLQRPALHPDRLSREERGRLFDLCQANVRNHHSYIEKWFLGTPVTEIKKDNIKDFFRWAFLSADIHETEFDDEVEEYVAKFEEKIGRKFEPGRADVSCIRLTIDAVGCMHRSLIWYMCILVVDILTHIYMRLHKFEFHRASILKSLAIIPPRPHALFTSHRSPARELAYWYRPHTSCTERPILFLHGIGVGLWPYMSFLDELNDERGIEDGKIGVLAIEILSVSTRITEPMPQKDEMCGRLRLILDHHDYEEFVLVSHSYGSVITTHLLKTADLSHRISSVILVDPVTLLLHQPDVAYNFVRSSLSADLMVNAAEVIQTIRSPKLASEWLLWYFGSKDMGTAHTLSRTFFWSENILWKEDLAGHGAVVFLGSNDSVLNATQVREYLCEEKAPLLEDDPECSAHQGRKKVPSPPAGKGRLEVVWCQGLDHGQVFDSASWRNLLRSKVLEEVKW